MSSGGLRISHQNYYSTHNALINSSQDQSVRFVLYELNGTRHGALRIYPFYDIQMVKRLLIKKLSLPTGTEVKDLRILYKCLELPNYRTMDSYINSAKTEHKLYWCLRERNPSSGIRALSLKINHRMDCIINEIALSMKYNIKPKLTMDGTGTELESLDRRRLSELDCLYIFRELYPPYFDNPLLTLTFIIGGTYLMFTKSRKCCAIFKPIDEEAFAPCNPRGYEGKMNQQGFRPGVLSGEGASREVAAYILDSSYGGVCGVPVTTMVEATHASFRNNCDSRFTNDFLDLGVKWKPGSLQEYIEPRGTSGNYNPTLFSTSDVHRIGILDLRVMNLDRNDGNILVVSASSNSSHKSRYRLVPIDHGLILPDVIDVADIDLVWFDWPQSKAPFSLDELDLIYSLDPDRDAERLRKHLLIRTECLRTMKVTVRLLQIATCMHLNLHQTTRIFCRNDIDSPSQLEILIKRSIEQAYKLKDATSLMTTNRLRLDVDLFEYSMAMYEVRAGTDYDSLSDDDEYESFLQSSNKVMDNSRDEELPSSAFFQYPNIQELKSQIRTTHRRRRAVSHSNSIWSLEDSKGHPIDIEWDNKFETIFFKVLVEMFVSFLKNTHPNWRSYDYNGETIEQLPWYNVDLKTFTNLWFKCE